MFCETHCIQMTDLPTIMDKIRILRSNRRKANRSINDKTASVTMAPVPTSEVVFSSPQQWVPFLVLDIREGKDAVASDGINITSASSEEAESSSKAETVPLLTAVPVTSTTNSSAPIFNRVISTSMSTPSEKTIIKTTTTKRSSPRKNKNMPVACTITVTSKDLKNSKDKTNKTKVTSEETPVITQDPVGSGDVSPPKQDAAVMPAAVMPAAVPESFHNAVRHEDVPVTVPESQKDSEPLQLSEPDLTTTLAPVGCVICSKYFSTLTEMQAHYLSEHKNRRGRESRKRNVDGVNVEAQKNPHLVSIQDKESADDSDFKLPLYVSESDPKCPVCSIAFKSALEVKNHVKLVHSYRCSECNDTFYTLFEFTGHKCSKGVKKLKKIRKKSNRSPNLNQEVAKAMKSFVPIQPKVKKKSKVPEDDLDIGSSLVPPLLARVSETSSLPVCSSPSIVVNTCSQGNGLQLSASTTRLQITTGSADQPEVCETNNRTPSPNLTISPLDNKQKCSNIRVLETKNLRCFKFKKDEIVSDSTSSKTELIQEKLAQLKNNPHVSVSWIPRLRIKTDEDSEYVCGRCNVICDDMEDYMDHIHDCLTITSVTLERTSNPPQRILKLQKEVSSFGFQETNNNRYSINKNLMMKLKEVLPLTEEHVVAADSHLDENHHPPEMINPNRYSEALDLCPGHSGGLRSGDANFSEVDEKNSMFSIKEEPVDDFLLGETDLSTEASIPPIEEFARNIHPSGNSRVTSMGNSKGTPPMVIIPVNQAVTSKFLVKGDQLINKMQSPKQQSPESSLPSSPWDSSPLDLLIDTDDIKMEVEEEELMDDDFKDL